MMTEELIFKPLLSSIEIGLFKDLNYEDHRKHEPFAD